MHLVKVHFDAYKSLLNKELDLENNCIGLVGKNESGKSNVLNAIASLSGERFLTRSDAPRMGKRAEPHLRFRFSLSDTERKQLAENVATMAPSSAVLLDEASVVYEVSFDRATKAEQRRFVLEGVKLAPRMLTLRSSALADGYVLTVAGELRHLSSTLVIGAEDLKINERRQARLGELRREIETAEGVLDALEGKSAPGPADEGLAENTVAPAEATDPRVAKKRAALERLLQEQSDLRREVDNFDISAELERALEEGADAQKRWDELESNAKGVEARIAELASLESPDDTQTKEVNTNRKSLVTLRAKQARFASQKESAERRFERLSEPLRNKFTSDATDLETELGTLLQNDWLPRVVLWKYSEEYILRGETEFDEIKDATKLNQISRPLVNLFRIGLGVQTLEELKQCVEEIQSIPVERSRNQERMNKRIGQYLESVWPEYDQDIRISLEQERIRVEFFDPNCEEAGHYVMEERSQGCKTFISFLLTVGAEAKHGVIKDTVLLLDEPETHLHPSGVRFMLQELLRVAEAGNKVIFATHSVFMIDQENYDRHVILTKKDEQTVLQPSRKERIGFFMQEEVLYSALDINLGTAFETTRPHNFVLEGDGDVALFQHLYMQVMKERDRPFAAETTRFYHGGKCTDIIKYLKRKPIQLGSKWVFVIDRDGPANDLRAFIESKYGSFMNEHMFVLQYDKEGVGATELEDLLPPDLIALVASSAAKTLGKVEHPAVQSFLATPDEAFGERFTKLVTALADEKAFKSIFKDGLNSALAERLKTHRDRSSFDEAFPLYSAWAKTGIETLRGAQTSKADRRSQ